MFEKRLAGIARRYFGHVVEWEDALESGVEVAKEVAIMRWLKDDEHLESYATAGHVTIDNDYWNAYLDHDWKWEHAYRFQNRYPHHLSVGGEMCMWAEKVDKSNFLCRVWAPGVAVAATYWSNPIKEVTAETCPEHDSGSSGRGLNDEVRSEWIITCMNGMNARMNESPMDEDITSDLERSS